MEILLVLLGVVLFIVIFVIIPGIKIVQQSTVVVVERLGKYHKTLETGVNLIIPFLDKVRPMKMRKMMMDFQGRQIPKIYFAPVIDLRENVHDFPRQNVITKDNVTIEINAMLYYQITDPFKAMYEIEDLAIAIEKLTQTTLRNVVGELELDETLASRDIVNVKLREILDEATDKWGVKINRVELQDINPPKDIKEAMEKQMRAERERRETILIAEGDKRAKVLAAEGERDKLIAEAEGNKQSAILAATGEAEAKLRIAKAEAQALAVVQKALEESKIDVGQYMIATKYVNTLGEIAGQNGEKVIFLPFESSALLGSVGSIKELFTKA